MAANAHRFMALDSFRSEWVCGHLDSQRASEALETAQRAAERLSMTGGVSLDDEAVRGARHAIEAARRRLAQVETELAERFDRFCGVAHRA